MLVAALGSACDGERGDGEDRRDDDAERDDDTTHPVEDDTTPGGDDDSAAAGDDDTTPGVDDDTTPGGDDDSSPSGELDPPLHGSSGGSGGGTCPSGCVEHAATVTYRLIVPSSYASGTPAALLLVYSGTEGGEAMMANMRSVQAYAGLSQALIAVLDGVDHYGDGPAGGAVLDDVRARWNVDNDRTWLLSESAGTSAGLELGLDLRQSWFAAYWANDVNAAATPARTAADLGFAPWGNAGPGGDFADAGAIVAGMAAAGYRLPADAPYSGAGAGTHGSTEQFLEAVSFFADKRRE
ncbi:hypothetical protein L6R50_24980 [Myxococcota bacterium]|nr:hypothetical protein [Myxococcota bacterium]